MSGRKGILIALAALAAAALAVTVIGFDDGGSSDSDAETVSVDDYSYLEFEVTDEENHEVSVAAADGATLPSNLKIPGTVSDGTETYTVTSVAESGFYYNTDIVRVKLPDTVTTLSDGSFSVCINLLYIYIPTSVTYIGDFAFTNCW